MISLATSRGPPRDLRAISAAAPSQTEQAIQAAAKAGLAPAAAQNAAMVEIGRSSAVIFLTLAPLMMTI